jgi:uncharacterized cupin superfamily protein
MSTPRSFPTALAASEAPARPKPAQYPAPLAIAIENREKRSLGDLFGITNFGINLTRILPGGCSALRHAHARQDEFIYILEGCPTLVTNEGDTLLAPGMCAGFPAGTGNAHHLINRTESAVVYLEVGDRTAQDTVTYPDEDLQAICGTDGKWQYQRKDGSPY